MILFSASHALDAAQSRAIVDFKETGDPETLRPHGAGAAGVEGSPGTQSGR